MENLEKLLPQALMEANLLQFQDALKTDPPPDFSPRYRRIRRRLLSDPFRWARRRSRPPIPLESGRRRARSGP